jgi:hypothetical protein
MMSDYQQRMFEFQRDEYGEHHSKQTLEKLGISRIEKMAFDMAESVKERLPSCEGNDESNDGCEYCNDRLLEFFS